MDLKLKSLGLVMVCCPTRVQRIDRQRSLFFGGGGGWFVPTHQKMAVHIQIHTVADTYHLDILDIWTLDIFYETC